LKEEVKAVEEDKSQLEEKLYQYTRDDFNLEHLKDSSFAYAFVTDGDVGEQFLNLESTHVTRNESVPFRDLPTSTNSENEIFTIHQDETFTIHLDESVPIYIRSDGNSLYEEDWDYIDELDRD